MFDNNLLGDSCLIVKRLNRIYGAMEKMSGRRGAEIIYIDDRLENVEAGSARGWRTVLHETPEKTRAAVEKFLL